QVIGKEHPNTLLISLISSQVDADRMDYLLRDAYNCGVSYGNYDMERLLRSMIVVNGKIAFKESGIHAIEDYMFARYHMYWQVYLHPTASSFEIILSKVLARIKQLMNENYQFKTDLQLLRPFASTKQISIKDYLALDEASLIHYFALLNNEEDPILSNLTDCFNNRKLFKYLKIKDEEAGNKIIERVETNPLLQQYYFEKEVVSSGFYQYYGQLNPQSILISTKEKDLVELHKVSSLVNAIVASAMLKKEMNLYFHQNYQGLING
ncbi:MAG: HD domain-containing protein, partial [Bacilli bacterium]